MPLAGPDPVATADPADEAAIDPPDDDELWRYTLHTGRWFLRLSAVSRTFLGAAMFFLALRGDWLKLLMPVALMMIAGAIISVVWSFQVRPFDRAAHVELLTDPDHRTSGAVDVFITTCGEDPLVIRNTIRHAAGLAHPGKVRVYVLDDKGSEDVRRHAAAFGATYLHRPNRGWMKKAGNLHYAYGRSTGEFIVVLDADFAARPDFLTHTLPYFADETVGIVQTPQFFRVDPDNWVETGAASQQEQFYRIVQRARDRRGGAICVGTNAVYRRSALDARGGMALLEHSEDLFTGMKVIDAGYRVSYLPVVLAAGSAPSTTRALASQQYRWARGTFALAGTPLFKRLRLTLMQRMSIWDGWIYYASSALSPIVAVVVPIVTLAEAPGAISLSPALMLAPSLITEFVIQPRWLIISDGTASRRVGLISQVAHLFALRDHLSDREQEWVPTGDVGGGRRQATDRIPELIAAVAFWSFLVTVGLVGIRVAGGYDAVALAPVVLLAMIALPTALSVTNDADRAVRPPAEVDTGERDGFLDTVRGISIVRVMFWHALGLWWISWVIAAMPAVFYVSGALVAKSLRSKSATAVVRARLRRLLPPYATFIGVSLTAVFIAHPDVWRTHPVDLLSWIIPFQSPAELPWEEGWLSTPLWFLRALIVVLVLFPLARRIGRWLSAPAWAMLWAGTLIALDVLIADQTGARATAILRGVGDVVCFGGFFALGAGWHHRRHELGGVHHKLRALFALIVLTAVVTWMAPPPQMVVNNSNVTMALVGLCWLMAIILSEDHIRRLGDVPGIHRVLGWVAANSMTVYLWHTAVLCIAFAIVGPASTPLDGLLLAMIFAPLLVAAVISLRPFEIGWSTKRSRHPVRPLRLVVVAAVVAALTMQPTLFPTLTNAVSPPAPSGRPEVGTATDAGVDQAVLAVGGIEGWMRGNGVASAVVVVAGGPGGEHHRLIYGDDSAPDPADGARPQTTVDPAKRFEVLSVTKTMVAATALQLVEEGVLSLDAPLPDIPGLPRSLTANETLRRLLAHASGLVDYRTLGWFTATTDTDPLAAVLAAYEQSDTSSSKVSYSATNYFLVGTLIEQVTGSSLASQLDQRLFAPLAMDDTEMVDNSRDGFVGFASAGVVSTLDDLAIWYDALFRGRTVLGPAMLDEMIWGGERFSPGTGLGAWRHCPCRSSTTEDSTPWSYLFQDGGDVRIMYFPDQDVVMVARFSKPLYLTPALASDLDGFVYQVLREPAVVTAGS